MGGAVIFLDLGQRRLGVNPPSFRHCQQSESAMTDTSPSLYAAREPIFPKRVSGKFRNLKWLIMLVTLGIYYLTPWIRWDRGPELPDQAVLIDLAGRRFYLIWIKDGWV